MDIESIKSAREKKEILVSTLKKMPSLLVAFSGGVDSSFLLAVAYDVLKDRVIAATADSITFPSREKEEAIAFASKLGVEHIVFQSDESTIPEFVANGADRCYFCKKSLSKELIKITADRGIEKIAFAANMDDLKDYRPGIDAAKEMGIISPLIDAGLNKEEIRLLSREMGLSTWNKPAMACLASRIPYGTPVTIEKLETVEDAEDFLFDMGFRQLRVRHHGPVARIETSEMQFRRFLKKDIREKVIERFKKLGFKYVSLDLEGFVSGSMNRTLP
ncbi:MAG TPA: ATP-dependent sacrificial sulfur transferase LarE [Desulfatiglandales bacterium]|nr:ATP-dependent sacrificial sulfur transferase LarE [Desulfatiglandales bacterium]